MADGQRASGAIGNASGTRLSDEARARLFTGLKKGRIVYFTDLTGTQRPAIVTKVFENSEVFTPTGVINLVVFMDDTMCVSYRSSVPHFIDVETKIGCWDWMFEGQNVRYQPDRVEAAAKG